MASSRRRRRPQGHPAKIAERRGRRGGSSRVELRRVISAMCRDATRLETAFDAELWASQLLGMWSPPGFGADADDGEREVGAVFVEELEQIGGDGALSALT